MEIFIKQILTRQFLYCFFCWTQHFGHWLYEEHMFGSLDAQDFKPLSSWKLIRKFFHFLVFRKAVELLWTLRQNWHHPNSETNYTSASRVHSLQANGDGHKAELDCTNQITNLIQVKHTEKNHNWPLTNSKNPMRSFTGDDLNISVAA